MSFGSDFIQKILSKGFIAQSQKLQNHIPYIAKLYNNGRIEICNNFLKILEINYITELSIYARHNYEIYL